MPPIQTSPTVSPNPSNGATGYDPLPVTDHSQTSERPVSVAGGRRMSVNQQTTVLSGYIDHLVTASQQNLGSLSRSEAQPQPSSAPTVHPDYGGEDIVGDDSDDEDGDASPARGWLQKTLCSLQLIAFGLAGLHREGCWVSAPQFPSPDSSVPTAAAVDKILGKIQSLPPTTQTSMDETQVDEWFSTVASLTAEQSKAVGEIFESSRAYVKDEEAVTPPVDSVVTAAADDQPMALPISGGEAPLSAAKCHGLAEIVVGGRKECSGQAIAKNLVVTAAHCMTNNDKGFYPAGDVSVCLPDGDLRKCSPGNTYKAVKYYFPKKYILSPSSNYDDDIAFVELDRSIPDFETSAHYPGIFPDPQIWPKSGDNAVYHIQGFGKVDPGVDRALAREAKVKRQNTGLRGRLLFSRGDGMSQPGDSGGPVLRTKDGVRYLSGTIVYEANANTVGTTNIRFHDALMKGILNGTATGAGFIGCTEYSSHNSFWTPLASTHKVTITNPCSHPVNAVFSLVPVGGTPVVQTVSMAPGSSFSFYKSKKVSIQKLYGVVTKENSKKRLNTKDRL